jgi:hypothetical protein
MYSKPACFSRAVLFFMPKDVWLLLLFRKKECLVENWILAVDSQSNNFEAVQK